MKKILLTLAALATLSASSNAQTRMTLHEEFTGENCGPCAATNPDFWELCDSSINVPVLIHISYMVPIPSAGIYCDRTSDIVNARCVGTSSYYNVPFAPDGRYDGHIPDPGCSGGSDPGHPGCFTQADIDSEAAIADSFTFSAFTCSWNADYDSVTMSITITAGSHGWTSTTPYLRTALVETQDWAFAPGSNGETHFENVVQAMYPDPTGTTVPATWTAGESHTYVLAGPVPTFVDRTKAPYMVAWIQDDANHYIAQAGKSPALPSIPLDGGAVSSAVSSNLICATGSTSIPHTMVMTNSGMSTPLTSAIIYYKVDNGAYTSYAWTGSLAVGANTTVTLPSAPFTVGASGYHTITDSFAMPNGIADINPANNVSGTSFFVENTNGIAMPYSTSFENIVDGDTSLYFTDNTGNGATWGIWQTGTTGVYLGHSGTYAAGFPLGEYPTGTVNSIVLPEVNITNPSHAAIKFWVAYSQQTAGNTDELEVVYSTDCGNTWTSLWNLSGTPMVTLPAEAASTAFSYPTSPSQYKEYVAPLTGVTAGSAMLGFRATDGGGNFLVVDDIDIVSTVGVDNVAAAASDINIYPNPANDEAKLAFNLAQASDVQVQVIDGLGRVMNVVANEKMDAGTQLYTINTANLASGVYNVTIHTDGGTSTKRLTIVR